MALTKATYSMVQGACFNVLDFGATGDGTTDDTTAIQAAINAAEGNALYIPKGTYKCTSQIQIKANTLIFGAGRNASILRFTHTGRGLFSSFPVNTNEIWSDLI